jgi:type VI secretion system FHA domain protein
MPLTLTVTSYKGAPPSKPASINIEHESISIGREKGNSLVLNDPECIVSGNHAKIEHRKDGYYITDTSTNHTLIDQPDKQVSKSQTLRDGQSAKLNNNDLLTFGDYEIQVSITNQHDQATSDDMSYRDGYENSESLLKNDNKLESGSDDPFADIMAVVEEKEDLLNQEARIYDADDDFSFLDSIGDSDDMSVDNDRSNPDATDLFADIQPVQKDKDNLSHANTPAHKAVDDFSFLDSVGDSDDMSVEKGPPNPDATDLFAVTQPVQKNKDNLSQANAPVHKAADEFSFLDSIEEPGQLRADNNIPNTDTIDPLAEIEPAIEDKKKSLKEHDKATTPPQRPAQQPPSISSTEIDPEHIRNFLKGAGIEGSSISSAMNANTFYLIGQLLSHSLQGAIQVLWARAKIKNELGLEVTIVHGRKNNPLKFSPSAQEALVKMLEPQGQGYMPANEAIDEAFSDIGAHEMAVMAGMRSALHDVLKRFHPEHLEQRLQKKSPIGVNIPIRKQAMLWNLFEDLYDEIETEAQDDFSRLFGRAFAKAYDDHLRKSKNTP